MSELKRHFERLMEFAKNSDFRQPFSRVYLAENKNVRWFFEKPGELSGRDIFAFENYESRFDELLKQGYSWVNLSFAGMFDDNLLILIEAPRAKTGVEITAVNLSLPGKGVAENDWKTSIKII